MDNSKPWYKSRTIIALVLLNGGIAAWNQLSPNLNLSVDTVATINLILGTLLRSITTGPVTLSDKSS